MKLKIKEDPKEWRKAACFSMLGLGLLTGLLCWREVLPVEAAIAILAVLAAVALTASVRPHWFRGYYRAMSHVGFRVSQFIGYVVLTLVFLLLITPMGFVLRLLGKDPLRLKAPPHADSHWRTAKETSPLDRMF